MNDPLQAFLQGTGKLALFPTSSRYYGIETAQLTTPAGTRIAYVRRRFAPQPDDLALVQEHSVVEGDRLDNLAAKYFGDPEQFWRLCDANGAIRPEELIETAGRKLRITLPQGVPGVTNA
jgi:hypothetical protein